MPAESGDAARRGRTRLQRVELVGDTPQVVVDGRRVVPAAAHREVTALDCVSIHGGEDSHAASARRAVALGEGRRLGR